MTATNPSDTTVAAGGAPDSFTGAAFGQVAGRGWGVTVAVTLFMAVNFADKSVLGLAADPLRDELGLSASQFGLTGSIFFLLFGVFGILGGFIGNRIRPTRILLVLAIAWAVCMLPVLIAPAFATLLISRMALGAAEGPAMPLAIHTVHKWFPESKRPVPTSLVLVGAALGVGISAPILGHVISASGWRAAFWLLVALTVAWAVVWWFVGREGPFDTYRSADDLAEDAVETEPPIPYWDLLKTSAWWGSLLSIGPGFCAFALFSVWAPSYLSDGYGFSKTATGAAIGVTAICAIIFQLGGGALSAHLVRRGVDTRWARGGLAGFITVLGGVFLTVGMLLGFSGLAPWLMVIGVGLCNSGNPVAYLSVSEISPVRQRSAVLAVYNSVMTTGGAIAPLVAGILVDHAANDSTGYREAFLIFGVLAIAGGLIGALTTNPSRDARRLGLRKASAA